MRESGFDPSDRFGPFSAGIIDHNPVCLNTLLYQMEKDLAEICVILNYDIEAKGWISTYMKRREVINHYMWDDEEGLYFDFNFVKKQRSDYKFATAFYPMWAEIPDEEQVKKLVANLSVFERSGGMSTSDNTTTKSQWDDPIGWAPIQIIVTQALLKYGYKKEAERIARKWCSTVLKEFNKHGTIFEKYDVRKRSYDVDLGAGYRSNEIGFGWTNASFLLLLDMISDPEKLPVK
jgi:alpha,alpha-trehalase